MAYIEGSLRRVWPANALNNQEFNIVGESPLWDHRQAKLYWVDIDQAQLHCLDFQENGRHQFWHLPSKAGSIGLANKNQLVGALRKYFALLTPQKNDVEVTLVSQPLSEQDGVRFNDGKVDPQGRFWAGTADINEELPIGGLYKLDHQGHSHLLDTGFTVSNGIAWSLDHRLMYFTDSPARTIYVYDYEADSGKISHRRVFAKIAENEGYPDGLTIDAQGYLWSAHWDGWRITRYSPEGHIDCVVEVPVQRPTSCCFGGEDLQTLYITSARRNLTLEQLATQETAGCVFALSTTVKGLPEPVYRYTP